jgi:hypothetical protein
VLNSESGERSGGAARFCHRGVGIRAIDVIRDQTYVVRSSEQRGES